MLSDTLKHRLKSWTRELLVMSLILFVIANALSYLRAPKLEQNQLPEISTLLSNGELFSTQDFSDGPVLIHFWATWCPTCKLEASNIQAIADEYNVLSIAVKSKSDENINQFLKQRDLGYKVINDNEGILAQNFSVQAYPTTFIYNAQGELSFTEVGYTSTWGLKLRMWWASL